MTLSARLAAIVSALVAAVVLSACIPQTPPAEQDTPSVVVLLSAGEESLNPYSVALTQRRIGRLVFQGLLGVGEDLEPTTDLCSEVPTAANGGISDDGRTITYRLRDARFHDGVAVTSADVVFTIELLRSGALVDEPGVDSSIVESVTAPDAKTVVVRLRRADAAAAWRLAPYVLPKHLLEGSGDLASDTFWLKPVGSGPYAVRKVRPGVEIELSRAGEDGPESMVVVFVPDDAVAREVFDSEPHVVWPDATLAPAGAGERLHSIPGMVWWRLGAVVREDSVIADDDVRKAARLVIESRLRSAASSTEATTGPYGHAVPAVVSDEVALSRASAVLDRAGWRRGRDGIRRKGGTRLSLQVRTPALRPAEGVAWDAIRSAAATAGIELEVRPGGPGYYGDFHDAGALAAADADLYVTAIAVGAPAGYGWPYSPSDVPTFERPAALNWQRLGESRLRTYTREIRSAGSTDEAAGVLRETWDHLDDEDLVVWLYAEPATVLVKRVSGAAAHPVASEALADAETWGIER